MRLMADDVGEFRAEIIHIGGPWPTRAINIFLARKIFHFFFNDAPEVPRARAGTKKYRSCIAEEEGSWEDGENGFYASSRRSHWKDNASPEKAWGCNFR